MIDTTNWASFPFTVEGINFIAKLDTNGLMYSQVTRIPAEIFTQYNQEAILNLIGNPALFSNEELEKELARVNEGASQAILALV